MKKIPDSLTQLKDRVFPIAMNGQWASDPDAAWIVADLERSAITPIAAGDAQLAYTSSRQLIGQLLNRRNSLPGGTCLVLPYFDALGQSLNYTRLKPEKPRLQERDGEMRPIKYDAPTSIPSHLYIPPIAVARLNDATVPLIVSEGEKKAIALNQHGLLAVSIPGVWNLLKKREGVERGRTFDDYEFRWPNEIPIDGRKVILLFDSDTLAKSNLPLAMKYNRQHLRALNANVRVAKLPDGPNGEKMGADDYLAANGPDALQAILDAAEDPSIRKDSGKCAKEPKESKPSAADLLAAIGMQFDLWHDADERAYASQGRRTYSVKSKSFRTLLVAKYREQTGGGVPATEAISTAILAIEGAAIHDGPEHEANARVAECAGRIYVHLADSNDTVIEVGPDGWRECECPPVRFVRVKGMLALPFPKPGGHLDDLRRIINVPAGQLFALTRAWIAQALRKHGPFPLLILLGEQGSAKTTTGRVLKRLIDPRSMDVRAEPKETRDLMIAATNNWVLVYDNISFLPAWLSDALCRLSTGGGFGTRGLYTDDEEQTFNAKRPLILNGIEEFVTRADLLERSLLIPHEHIEDTRRRPESMLWAEFDDLAPGLLGAVFDYVSGGLCEISNARLKTLPRMADFAIFAVACEIAQGRDGSEFLTAYQENQSRANEQVLDESPVTMALCTFMNSHETWCGTATELLKELTAILPDEQRKEKEWPKRPNALSNKLKRLAPSLRRAVRIDVRTGEKDNDRKRTRLIVIRRIADVGRGESSGPSESSAGTNCQPDSNAIVQDGPTVADRPAIVQPSSDSPAGLPQEQSTADNLDDADDLTRPLPCRTKNAPILQNGRRRKGRI
jgi:hypothetical protein